MQNNVVWHGYMAAVMIKNRIGGFLADIDIFLAIKWLCAPKLSSETGSFWNAAWGILRFVSEFIRAWRAKIQLKTNLSLTLEMVVSSLCVCVWYLYPPHTSWNIWSDCCSCLTYSFCFIFSSIGTGYLMCNVYCKPSIILTCLIPLASCQRCLPQRNGDGSVHWPIYSPRNWNLSVLCQCSYW